MNNKEQKVETSTEAAIVGKPVLAAGYCPECGHETVVEDIKEFYGTIKVERCDGLIEIAEDKPLVACMWSQELG